MNEKQAFPTQKLNESTFYGASHTYKHTKKKRISEIFYQPVVYVVAGGGVIGGDLYYLLAFSDKWIK